MLEWYGATSEVPWLFLLSAWVFAFIATAAIYAAWNRAGLRLHLAVLTSRPAAGSPANELPEHLFRSAPLPAAVFEGDGLEIELGLDTSGASRGPAWISGFLGGEEITLGAGVVPRGGWRRTRVIDNVSRGPIGATSWLVRSSDALGFFRSQRATPDSEVALVLPRFASLIDRRQVRELEASAAAPRAGSGNELFGVREYRSGDSLRRIHWRSSARHGELVVREYEPPGVQTLGIFCDPSPASLEVADQIARLAASEAWDCIRDGGRVALWAPGLEPSEPSQSRSLWRLLEWLARFPGPQARPPADFPATGEVVGITAGSDPELLEALETVRRRGARVRAWIVGDVAIDLDVPIQRVGTEWPI